MSRLHGLHDVGVGLNDVNGLLRFQETMENSGAYSSTPPLFSVTISEWTVGRSVDWSALKSIVRSVRPSVRPRPRPLLLVILRKSRIPCSFVRSFGDL